MGGVYGSHNAVIATVPNVIPNYHVFKSTLQPQDGDSLHFTAEGYREFGKRYATVILGL